MDKKLYIVTVHKKEDLDSIYDDLETLGGSAYVPERRVDCSLRRPLSRNTHYYLTDDEAVELRKDPRVWDVQLPPEQLGLSFERNAYAVTQTGDFDKSAQANSTSVNWGLYRNFQEVNDSAWASNTTAVKTDTIEYNLSGRNVDIVIVDDTIHINHPDFAVNQDGTGGSRVQAINWYDYNTNVTALGDLDGQTLPTGTYKYLLSKDDYHGTPVASCAAGSKHGMAKAANIYNIEFLQPKHAIFNGSTSGSVLTVNFVYSGSEPLKVGDRIKGTGILSTTTISSFGTGTGGVGTYNLSSSVYSNATSEEFTAHYSGTWDLLLWDYLRAFHRNKTINPETGKRNPTIANCSFGLNARPSLSNIWEVEYRGTVYNSSNHSPWTLDELYSAFGVPKESAYNAIVPARYTAYEADMQDAIEDGIFFVSAGGNNNNQIVLSSNADYNNRLSYLGTNYYYHRGDVFSANPDVYIGGSIEPTSAPYKSSFSCCGDRIDMFAPGENVSCAASSTTEIGEIDRWEVTANVATFRILEPDEDFLSNLVGKEASVIMSSTTGLDGTYVIQSASYEPLKLNATLFTVNIIYADTPQTSETGAVIGDYTGYGQYPRDLRAPFEYANNVDGTSFSAPNLTGLIACFMEIYRRMDYITAQQLMVDKAAFNNMFDLVTSDYSSVQSLRDAPNLVAGYHSDPLYYQFAEERPNIGLVYPKNNYKSRFDFAYTGHSSLYPRVANYR